MAEDTRTVEQIEDDARRFRSAAADTRRQAEEALKVAEDWEKRAEEEGRKATARRASEAKEVKAEPRKAVKKGSRR